MPGTVQTENVVLGGGEAGKYIAWHLAEQGQQVRRANSSALSWEIQAPSIVSGTPCTASVTERR